MFYNDFETIKVHQNGRIFQLPKNPLSFNRYTVHANGTGLGWDEESPDIDRAHGLDYRQHQDLRKGVRIRAEKQHTTYGGSSCGGLHKPGKASILLVETTVNFADYIVAASLCGAARYGIAYDTSGYLWHVSDNTTSFCALGINPKSLCTGTDWTYTGALEFDHSVDFTGKIYVDGTVDIAGYLMCNSAVGMAEHLACNTGAQFLGLVTVCSFHCGTASSYADASFAAARFVCSSNVVFDATLVDFTGASNAMHRLASAWFVRDHTADGNPDNYYNISTGGTGVCYTTTGDYTAYCVCFANALPTANYAVVLTALQTSALSDTSGITMMCFSRLPTGFRFVAKHGETGATIDISGVSALVFGG